MELKTLKSFVAVAKLQSFSAAAKSLHTVQPAISRHIASLEQELGVQLFVRSSREVLITPAGKRLLSEAEALLASAEHAKENVIKTHQGDMGQLTIGYLGGATLSFFPQLIRQYSQRYPGVDINLIDMTVSQQLSAFEQQQIDIGFSRAIPERLQDEFSSLDIYQDSLIAVLPDHHPLANEKRIHLSQLKDETFVLFSRSEAVELFDAIISHCHQAGFSPQIKNEPQLMQTMMTQVAAGIGVSIAPGAVSKLANHGCRFVEIEGMQPEIKLSLHHKKFGASAHVMAFKQTVIEAIPTIRASMFDPTPVS